jgi:hypothetical protein
MKDDVKEAQLPASNAPEKMDHAEILEANREHWKQQTPAGRDENTGKGGPS